MQTFGDALRALDYTMDRYTECAALHNALVEFEQRKK